MDLDGTTGRIKFRYEGGTMLASSATIASRPGRPTVTVEQVQVAICLIHNTLIDCPFTPGRASSMRWKAYRRVLSRMGQIGIRGDQCC